MEKYANTNRDSGISGYEIGGDYIWGEFSTGSIYEHTYSTVGRENIETMKNFALSGSGLNGFINSYVKLKYYRRNNQNIA